MKTGKAVAALLLTGAAMPAYAAVEQPKVVGGIALAMALAAFLFGFAAMRLKRLIENLPTSRIRSMALGLVEVKGKTVAWNTLRSPFTEKPCVFYRYTVEEWRESDKDHHDWSEIHRGDSSKCPFYVEDETGRVLVFPHKADLRLRMTGEYETSALSGIPAAASIFLDSVGVKAHGLFGLARKLRLREYRADPGEELYVLGTCGVNDKVLSASYVRALRGLKRGPSPGEKKIEWGAGAPKEAAPLTGGVELPLTFPVGTEPQEPLGDDRVVIHRGDPPGPVFLISDKGERDLAKSQGLKAFFGILFGLGLGVVGMVFLLK